MPSDYRVETTWWDHRKTRSLVRIAGWEAATKLHGLWAYASEQRPNGVLSGLSDLEIEDQVRWSGEPGAFIAGILESRWAHRDDKGTIHLHEWVAHQPYASRTMSRSESGRIAGIASGRARRGVQSNDSNDVQRSFNDVEPHPSIHPPYLPTAEVLAPSSSGVLVKGGAVLPTPADDCASPSHAASPTHAEQTLAEEILAVYRRLTLQRPTARDRAYARDLARRGVPVERTEAALLTALLRRAPATEPIRSLRYIAPILAELERDLKPDQLAGYLEHLFDRWQVTAGRSEADQ